MRDYKQEMRDYGMDKEAIELAEDIADILGKSFEEVCRTKHTHLLKAIVDKHKALVEGVALLFSPVVDVQPDVRVETHYEKEGHQKTIKPEGY